MWRGFGLGPALMAITVGGLVGVASTQPATAIRLENAWARRAPMMDAGGHGGMAGASGNGAVYVTVRNVTSEPDTLVATASDVATTVELHETRAEGGVMRMRPLETLDVPPGAAIEMKPGGYHLMLLGLTRDLKPGDTVALTLTFKKAGRLSVEAPVR